MEGRAVIRFNKEILIIKNLSAIDERVFKLRALPGTSETNKDDLKITSWNVIAMRPRDLTFDITFERPLRIS